MHVTSQKCLRSGLEKYARGGFAPARIRIVTAPGAPIRSGSAGSVR